MAIVMNMSNYEIERTAEVIESDNISLRNEWQLTLVQLNLKQFVPTKLNGSIPADLARVNIEMFLQSMIK
jgi:hypothetical protein